MRFIQELNTMIHTCGTYCVTETFPVCPPNFEFFGVLEGQLQLSPTALPLKEGTVLIIPPGSSATLTPVGRCVLMMLAFSPKLFLSMLDEDALFTEMRIFPKELGLMAHMAALVECVCRKSFEDCFRLPALIMPILGELTRLLPPKTVPLPDGEKMTGKQTQFLTEILAYTAEAYREELSLSDAAAYFQVTPQYFASFFKRFMHRTFHEYLLDLRCRKGAAFLAHTDLSPEYICREVGLNGTAAFKKYVRSHKGTLLPPKVPTQLGSALTAESARRYLTRYTAPTSADTISANPPAAAIDAKVSFRLPFQDSFRRLINLGYASGFNSIRIFNQLVRTQEEIGFTYGRICRLFDLISEYIVGKKTIYDYNRIFRILDVMLEHDMLPFIELGNKLFRIQLNLLETVPLNLLKDTVSYYERLISLLPDFIRACVNRYGQECFDQWRFEISYTNYDLAESAEDFPLVKYIRYFCKIRKVIRRYSVCAIGGPGFNYWNSPQRLTEILSLFAANQAMPDFVTAYVYPLAKDDADAALSENGNLTEERLQILKDVTHSRCPGMEIWVTEFNSNLSSRNLLNDSSYQSAYLAKTLTAAARLQIAAMGYYLLSDVPLRYVDSLDMLFGGWGLFSDKDIPKPSYHAYSLMAKLGRYLLENSGPYLLTCNSDYSFQCLFYHYEHITPTFCRKNVGLRELCMEDTVFCPTPAGSMEFCIDNVRPGTYLVKEYVISRARSNLLTEWERTGYLTLSKMGDILALKTRSSLIPEMHTIEVRPNAPLLFQVSAKQHEVRLLEIELNS